LGAVRAGSSRGTFPRVEDDPPLGTAQGLFHFTDGALAHAVPYLHDHDSPVHTHSFVEIAFIVSGSGTHNTPNGRDRLGAGDVILLRPGIWHGYESCHQLSVYNCCFSSELLRRELAWTREDPLLGYLLWAGPYSSPARGMLTTALGPQAFRECLTHLDALAALRDCPQERHRGDVIGRLSLLFSQLGQAVARPAGISPASSRSTHPAVGRTMRLLEAEPARHWTLSDLADDLHLTPGHLVRLFKDATGLPPMAYLAQVRAEHAAVLLLHSDDPITSIGRAVGWPDQNYFARRFKAHYGLSATAYRKRFATQAAHLDDSGVYRVDDSGVYRITDAGAPPIRVQ
jgi:AraC family transcriptional regulator, L-rhamnose operon transcriptional activator RhaR